MIRLLVSSRKRTWFDLRFMEDPYEIPGPKQDEPPTHHFGFSTETRYQEDTT